MPTSIEQPFVLNNTITKNGLKTAILIALGAFILQLGSIYATQVNPHVTNTYALPIALWCAILFFVGRQYWPVVLCTSFISLIAFKTPVAVAALYAVTLTVGAFAIVKIDRAFYKRPLTVTTLSDILRIALNAVALGALAALMSAVSDVPFGDMTLTASIETGMFVFERVALRCFLAFPVLIIWSKPPKSWANPDSIVKLVFFICVWTVVSYPMFFSATSGATAHFERGYFIFVLTPFVGLYLGAHGVTLSTALLYSYALVGSFFTTGGFYQSDTLDLTQLRVFMTCHAISGLVTIVVIELLKKQKDKYTTTEEIFRQAIDAIPMPIAVMNQEVNSKYLGAETRMDFVNLSFTHQTGYTSAELPDLGTWWRLAYPDEAYRRTMIDDRAKFFSIDPYAPSKLESWVQCRDGSKKLFSWDSFSIGGRIISLGQDLTQANSEQNSLKIAASLYQAIGAMVAITDQENKIIAVNPAFLAEIGLAEQELLGRGITAFVSLGSANDSFKTIWEQLNHHAHFEGEIQIQPKHTQTPVVRHLSIYTSPSAESNSAQRVWLFSHSNDAKRARAQTQRQAQYDPLTGLANRRLLTNRLENAITRASQNQSRFCLIFIDLDDFKDINDTRGHDVGDDVLIAVANRLQRLQRTIDTTARLGGDEFTLIYNEIGSDSQLETRIALLLKEFEQPFNIKNTVYQVSISVGVAQYPRDGQTSREILMRADQAMYAAKRDGKGRHRLFDPSLQQQANEKQQIISEIRQAVERQEFELYFQPILALDTQNIVKAEALLRWNFPGEPTRMPAMFLEHAESSGLILPLGAWAFTQAAQACHQFNQTNPGFSVAVNISATQLSSREDPTPAWIKECEDRELNPSLLTLEITKQVMITPSASVRARIEQLKRAGFQFSIDDFGVGYSSLAVLQTTPFNYLKIDRHFVSTLEYAPESQAVVRAIIELAHGLHMHAIAEGIETPTQLEILKELGCDFGQGYLLHRPMMRDQLYELLDAQESQRLPFAHPLR
jgi:diguanylate cyclase (GGDEF)-like protein/PAS domain S-box-containing protein